MELTPNNSTSLVSQYQLQQVNRSSNNTNLFEPPTTTTTTKDNHNIYSKESHGTKFDDKVNSSASSSSTQAPHAVLDHISHVHTQHEPQQAQLSHPADHQHHGGSHSGIVNNHNIGGTTGTEEGQVTALQQEQSKFFMSSLLNLSSATAQSNHHPSSIPFIGQGKYKSNSGLNTEINIIMRKDCFCI